MKLGESANSPQIVKTLQHEAIEAIKTINIVFIASFSGSLGKTTQSKEKIALKCKETDGFM